MQEVKVLVPDDRVPEFYQFFGAWLGGAVAGKTVGTELFPWAQTDEDLALAQGVWEKLSDVAQQMFDVLMNAPQQRFSASSLAEQVNIPNGRYGVAGVLAWPARHCYAVGRSLPVLYEDGATGDGANYWMTTEVAALFRAARGR